MKYAHEVSAPNLAGKNCSFPRCKKSAEGLDHRGQAWWRARIFALYLKYQTSMVRFISRGDVQSPVPIGEDKQFHDVMGVDSETGE